jgi:hypothetical protein
LNTSSNRFEVITQYVSVERAVDNPCGAHLQDWPSFDSNKSLGRVSSINRMLECSAGASEIIQQSKIPPCDIGVSEDPFSPQVPPTIVMSRISSTKHASEAACPVIRDGIPINLAPPSTRPYLPEIWVCRLWALLLREFINLD